MQHHTVEAHFCKQFQQDSADWYQSTTIGMCHYSPSHLCGHWQMMYSCEPIDGMA